MFYVHLRRVCITLLLGLYYLLFILLDNMLCNKTFTNLHMENFESIFLSFLKDINCLEQFEVYKDIGTEVSHIPLRLHVHRSPEWYLFFFLNQGCAM